MKHGLSRISPHRLTTIGAGCHQRQAFGLKRFLRDAFQWSGTPLKKNSIRVPSVFHPWLKYSAAALISALRPSPALLPGGFALFGRQLATLITII
jgi:hypothetical protein